MSGEAVDPDGEPPVDPLRAVVPSRAVLTELARGFLLLHERDPSRASRFAATFVREQAGPRDEGPIRPRLPSVHRSTRLWPTIDPPR